MSKSFPITIYHNPKCGTSRNTLAMIREAGHAPKVVEYLNEGWRRDELQALLADMGAKARDVLRARGTPAEELGLLEDGVSEEAILEAMLINPILVERPIVRTPKGVRLCRPAEAVKDVL
jgi:arsenate reductase